MALFLALLGHILGLRTTLPAEVLTSNRELLGIGCILFMVAFLLISFTAGLRFWLVPSSPAPRLLLARLRSFGNLLFYACMLYTLLGLPIARFVDDPCPTDDYDAQPATGLPLLRLEDLGRTRDPIPRLRRQSSILASDLVQEENADGLSLTQERWDCRFGWVANLIAADTLASYARSMPYTPADLGFDQAWTYVNGSGFHSLLLRQGNTVVQLYGSLDLTAPDRLNLLWDALELTD